MELSLTEMENVEGRTVLGGKIKGNQFEHMDFDVCIKYPTRDVRHPVVYKNLTFRR